MVHHLLACIPLDASTAATRAARSGTHETLKYREKSVLGESSKCGRDEFHDELLKSVCVGEGSGWVLVCWSLCRAQGPLGIIISTHNTGCPQKMILNFCATFKEGTRNKKEVSLKHGDLFWDTLKMAALLWCSDCASAPVTLRNSNTLGGPNNLQTYWEGLRIESLRLLNINC